jgi:hypothetical protein
MDAGVDLGWEQAGWAERDRMWVGWVPESFLMASVSQGRKETASSCTEGGVQREKLPGCC